MIERALALGQTKRAGVEGKGGNGEKGENAGEFEEGGRSGRGVEKEKVVKGEYAPVKVC